MPNCSICGKPIDRLPRWLDRVNVEFRCSECPGGAASPVMEPEARAEDDRATEEKGDTDVESSEAEEGQEEETGKAADEAEA